MTPQVDSSMDEINPGTTACPTTAAKAKAQVASSPLSRLHAAAAAAGLTCLSSSWMGWKASYPFRCVHGHVFMRSASFVAHHAVSCPECRDARRLAQLKSVADARGGQCLDTVWQGSGARHQFQCAHGHVWKAVPRKVIGEGSWCRRCAQQEHSKRMRREDGFFRMQDMATRRGGKLLDDEYAGLHARYRFSCAKGHHWQAEGAEIVRGSWCRMCANAEKRVLYRLPDGLARLQAAAQARLGICLASEYVQARSQYWFRCQHGHEWQTSGNRIFRGTWCPTCAHDRMRLSIDEMHRLARERGGLCLSEHYKNNSTKLHWECHRGHRWHAPAGTVRQGHWCAACAYLDKISNPRSKAGFKYLPVEQP